MSAFGGKADIGQEALRSNDARVDLIRFNPASARCQQPLQSLADMLLRLLIAMPLIIELQARPQFGVYRVGCRYRQLAVGRGLGRNSSSGSQVGRCSVIDR
jgi:hypothetical protein